MTIKLILACGMIISTCHAYDAKKINQNDLTALNNLDAKIYDLAIKKIDYSPSQVANFVYKNLAYKPDYSDLTIIGTVQAKGVQQEQSAATQYTNESSKFTGMVTLTYPFFDQKETLAREKKIIDTKQEIIKTVRKYFDVKAQIEDLYLQKEIALELETRAKSRKLAAVGSFDEWLKTVEDLRKINKDLTSKELELFENKESLLAMVTPHAKQNLKQML